MKHLLASFAADKSGKMIKSTIKAIPEHHFRRVVTFPFFYIVNSIFNVLTEYPTISTGNTRVTKFAHPAFFAGRHFFPSI